MPLVGKLESPIARSGVTVGEVSLLTQLKAIRGLGCVHMINPAQTAISSGGVVRCDDSVTGRTILSARGAPAIDTAINGKPSLTFGSAGAPIAGQMLRPKRYGDLDVGTGSWSFCGLIKATGSAGPDVIVGPERVASTAVGSYTPYIRLVATGDKTLGIAINGGDGSARSACSTHEFYNTVRVFLLCGTPGVGLKWYIDDWSSHALQSTTTAAKAAFTDGRFVVAGYGPVFSSFSYVGGLAYFSAHNVDLSLNDPARRDLMTEVAAYGGITST